MQLLTIPDNPVKSLLKRLSEVVHPGAVSSGSPPHRERRKHKRIPMTGEIKYRESGTQLWSTGWIQDFSYGGVRITATAVLPAEQKIDLRIVLPIGNDSTDLEGTIVWTAPQRGAIGFFNMGVSFSKRSAYQVQVVDTAANEMVALALQSASELTVRQALSIDDLQSSLALTYRERDPNRLGTKDEWTHYCNRWTFNSHTATFLLKSHEQTFGTATLVLDSEFGLPIDQIFAQEVSVLRSAECRLAEISLLALDTESLTEHFAKTELARLAAFMRLLKFTFDCAHTSGVTDLLIAVSPAHQNIFSYLQFIPLTDSSNPKCTRSMVPMQLNVARAGADRKSMPAAVLAYLYELPAVPDAAVPAALTNTILRPTI